MTNAEKHQEGMTLLKMLLTFIISIVSLCKKNRDCDPDSKSDPDRDSKSDPERDSKSDPERRDSDSPED